MSAHGPDGYKSTACRHADEPGKAYLHRECQIDAKRWDGSHKKAATCKYCEEQCQCSCHKRTH